MPVMCVLLCGIAWALPAGAQENRPSAAAAQAAGPRDIGATDPLRKVLLDALRPTIEKDLGQPVQFVVTTLRIQGNWAFADVKPLTPAGGKIDYMKTHHAERIREGVFGGGVVQALLRDDGGRWTVKDFTVGPTDVYYASWPEEFGVPYALFGLQKPD
jgi:hypothetical protein